MTAINPLDKNDLNKLTKAIKDLPLATEEEIIRTFSRTKGTWKQGNSPVYIFPKDIENQIKNILTTVCDTVKKKSQNVTRFIDEHGNGHIEYLSGEALKQTPYMGSDWNYEILSEEKKLRIDLSLKLVPSGNGAWVPFIYMKRDDGEYAFWFHDDI